jgi:hypothetical protein
MAGKHAKNGHVEIYGSQYFAANIYGFKGADPKNRPPACSLRGNYVSDIAVDGNGNLIDPDGGTLSVIVYRPNCGAGLGTISDPYGSPSDAASFDAVKKKIVVANVYGSLYSGGIAVCTLRGGCTKFLTNENMWEVAGVALARNNDCWASASDSAGTATLTYFKHCSGPAGPRPVGRTATTAVWTSIPKATSSPSMPSCPNSGSTAAASPIARSLVVPSRCTAIRSLAT